MSGFHIATELFEVHDSSGRLIYAPLLGVACQADSQLINTLCDISENIPPDARQKALHEQLLTMGFITRQVTKPAAPEMAPSSLDDAFLPCEVTLFLTSDCNLNCRYCYGEGGGRRSVMPSEIAYGAIDLLFANAAATDAPEVRISFHGGGEPTLEFARIQEMVAYARKLAQAEGRQVAFGLTSNGVVVPANMDWLIEHIDNINISFDGPEDIQNRHRPVRGGAGSFAAVTRSLAKLDAAGKRYYVRGTVTSYCEDRIPEIAAYMVGHHKVHTLQLEPMFSVGRALTTRLVPPDPHKFIHGFLEAERICRDAGVELKFSGFRYPRVNKVFCGVGRKNFAVTPEGLATACFEVLEPADPRSSTFFFGRFSDEGFVFDHDKIVALRKLNESVPRYCKNCFAQYHCNGDCRGKGLFLGTEDVYRGGGRCSIIQGLIKAKLFQTFQAMGTRR